MKYDSVSENVYDVLVAGGGPTGVAAAVAAARAGCKTALVERNPVVGGMGTAALVNNFCNAHYDGERLIIGGIFGRLRDRLIERRALYVTGALEPFNHEIYHEELIGLLEEAGVELHLGHSVSSVEVEGDRIVGLGLDNGQVLVSRYFVDATGDAHLAARSGVEFTFGRDRDGAVMPLTWCYLLGPVDREALRKAIPDAFRRDLKTGEEYIYIGYQEYLREKVRLARELGELTIPKDRIAVAYSMPGYPNTISVNFGRVRVQDPTDEEQMKQAKEEGLRQVEEGVRFFRKHVPGFEQAELQELARDIGVRESRQIVGLYRLTGEDVLEARQFDDVIAQACYSIDIHDPKTDGTRLCKLPHGQHYDIPLRCLIPEKGPENLIVGGRCISATQEAMSSFRVSPSVMAIGEAAGVAAAVAAEKGLSMKAVPYADVRERLLSVGAILD